MWSPDELEFLSDASIFPRKQELTGRMRDWFGLLHQGIQLDLGRARSQGLLFPTELESRNPNLSGGENHFGQPWLMLDYPALFEKDVDRHIHIWACRTMFLWGTGIIMSMHLQGRFSRTAEKLPEGWECSVTGDRWDFRSQSADWHSDTASLMEPGASMPEFIRYRRVWGMKETATLAGKSASSMRYEQMWEVLCGMPWGQKD